MGYTTALSDYQLEIGKIFSFSFLRLCCAFLMLEISSLGKINGQHVSKSAMNLILFIVAPVDCLGSVSISTIVLVD